MSHSTRLRRTPTRPIPPVDQPARLAALVAAVRARTDLVPEVGIVLGSGLGGLADDLEDAVAIPFADLPGWPSATAPGHAGRLLLGTLAGGPSSCSRAASTSTRATILDSSSSRSCSSGSWGADRRAHQRSRRPGPLVRPGTLMVMRDHINLTGRSPLIGPMPMSSVRE